jgi:predicted PurR-regulated permease PerM
MVDPPKKIGPWVTFAGCVLVVVVLYAAQAVLVPVALAALLTFILGPPVTRLERWLGRVASVLVTVALVFAVLGIAGWGVWREMSGLAQELPGYRANIKQKIADVRGAGKGGSVEKIQETIHDIKKEIEKSDTARGTEGRPLVVASQQVVSLWGFPPWLGPLVGPLSTAGLVAIMVVFMLLERRDLRDRVIGIIGRGHLAVTTRAFDEASSRVSRQLLMQSLVNLAFGVGVFVGLLVIGVPYALLWAVLAACLRFIPYVGPAVAAGAPLFVSLASSPGWSQPLWVLGLFLVLELLTNLVLEPVLYAGVAGVSQVALLVAVAFWTWLWGPLGLLLATPLTVCMVVLGKHVPGLEFVGILMTASPPPSADAAFYQRLLTRDQSGASDLLDRHQKSNPPDSVYDSLLLPALNYAERDRLEGRVSAEEEGAVLAATRELVADAFASSQPARSGESSDSEPAAAAGPCLSGLAYPANGAADELALHMLSQLLADTGVSLDVSSSQLLSSDVLALMRKKGYPFLCIADLPPSAPSKTRYLVKKLALLLPDVPILVGRWAPPSLADESHAALTEAGATHVASTLLETRERLRELALASLPTAPPVSSSNSESPAERQGRAVARAESR